MKRFIYILAIAILILPITAVAEITFLSKTVHSPESYPSVIERKIVRLDSIGESGDSVIWNFSMIAILSKNNVKSKSDSIVSIYENKGLSKLRVFNDTLIKIGYVENGENLTYKIPDKVVVYPFVFRDSIGGYFYSEGDFGRMSRLRIAGRSTVKADGSGMLILPENDTIRNVLRVHYHAVGSIDIDSDKKYIDLSTDTVSITENKIDIMLASDSVTYMEDKWQWYTKNNPYPIIERREYRIFHSGVLTESEYEVYFVPVSEQDYIVPTLEEETMAKERYAYLEQIYNKADANGNRNDKDTDSRMVTDKALKFSVYPKIIDNTVTISCNDIPVNAGITIFNSSGVSVKSYYGNDTGLIFPVELNMSDLPSGVYVISISFDGGVFSESVVKK